MYKVLVVKVLGDIPGFCIQAGEIRGMVGSVEEVNRKFDDVYNKFSEYGFGEICEIWVNEEYGDFDEAYDRLCYLNFHYNVTMEDCVR